MKKRVYEQELLRLQGELVVLQEWVRAGRAYLDLRAMAKHAGPASITCG